MTGVYDTLRHSETPEGVTLELRAAGPVVRSWAWIIDTAIRFGVYLGLAMFLPAFGDFGIGIGLIALFLIEWFYPVVFEIFNQGATPGKRILGIRVVRDDGLPVDWSGSMVRNILRVVDFLPAVYALGLVSMLADRNFRRLGDLVAGTLVIYAPKSAAAQAIPDAPALALTLPLSAEEQRSIVEFARRRQKLSPARADELAETLDPILPPGPARATNRLLGVANWILGARSSR